MDKAALLGMAPAGVHDRLAGSAVTGLSSSCGPSPRNQTSARPLARRRRVARGAARQARCSLGPSLADGDLAPPRASPASSPPSCALVDGLAPAPAKPAPFPPSGPGAGPGGLSLSTRSDGPQGTPAASSLEALLKVAPESLTYPPGFLGATPTPAHLQETGAPLEAPVDKLEYLRKILTSRVYDVAVETPLELAPRLSSRVGNNIFLKREDMQPVFSFKLRGAYNMMAHLLPHQLAQGVICSSAGNHAQGVALAASRLGCSAVIAMPVTTPEIKWRSVQRLGAEVVLVGDSYDATQAYAKLRAEEEGRVFIPPFDDPLIVAGQGTVGMEILRQFSLPACQAAQASDQPEDSSASGGLQQPAGMDAGAARSLPCALPAQSTPTPGGARAAQPGLGAPASPIPNGTALASSSIPRAEAAGDASSCCAEAAQSCSLRAVFVPVGGGGLIAGIAAYIKTLKPEVKVIGVEPADANAMALSLHHNQRVQLSSCGTFADGVAVRVVGEETFRISRELVDGVVLVSRDAICAAIKDMFEETRSILEPAGALSVAGAKAYCEFYGLRGENVVAVTSGANMNFDRLRMVAELADVGAKREAVVGTILQETPGAFKTFAEQLTSSMNITEFKYRYSNPESAYVLFSVGVHRPQELEAMISRLEAAGMPTKDLTDNDLAKDHLRHLVGGKALVPHEALFRFVFPERPGALMKFLEALSPRWNITLFHYRRQGEMGANILVGVQVLPEDEGEFFSTVQALGYDFTDERGNDALQMFM